MGLYKLSRRSLTIIALARPRTWLFATLAFFFGYVFMVPWNILTLFLGLTIFMMITASANLINAYYDRFEDEINQPYRTQMLDIVGLKNIRNILIILYTLILFLSTRINLLFFIIALIGVFDSIFYSAPPLRFKRNAITGMIAFSGIMAIPFIAGWIINKSLWQITPLFYLITFFFFTYFSIKNIPDFIGDKKANIKTAMTSFNVYEKGVYLSFFILFTPYILLLILLILQLISGIYYILYIFIPILVYLLKENLRNEGNLPRLEKLHTYGFLYSIAFLNLILFLSILTIEAILWIIFSILYLTLFMNLKTLDSRNEECQGGENY